MGAMALAMRGSHPRPCRNDGETRINNMERLGFCTVALGSLAVGGRRCRFRAGRCQR